MTEIPEHLLKRSRERRSAIGGGGDEAGGGDVGSSETNLQHGHGFVVRDRPCVLVLFLRSRDVPGAHWGKRLLRGIRCGT